MSDARKSVSVAVRRTSTRLAIAVLVTTISLAATVSSHGAPASAQGPDIGLPSYAAARTSTPQALQTLALTTSLSGTPIAPTAQISTVQGHYGIYSIAPDGSDLRQLNVTSYMRNHVHVVNGRMVF